MGAHLVVRVTGSLEEIESLVGDSSPHSDATCPECGAQLTRCEQLVLEDGLVARELTPMEAHLLLEGLGFPEERDCVADSVRDAFSSGVKKVNVKTIPGMNRSVIDHIVMNDGTTVFLTGSYNGASVYRIRKPNPYSSKEAV